VQTLYTIILAPNATILTGPGTNSIVLGAPGGAVVIDPASDNSDHLNALVQEGKKRGGIRRILITHGHSDHMSGAAALREQLQVPILAYNRQGVPIADEELADGATLSVGYDTLRAIYTPGHRFDHLCFYMEQHRILFAGDLISGITTNVIALPDGDMFDYMASLQRLQSIDIAEIVPGHGPTIPDAQAKITEYIDHRRLREQQILQTLETLPRGSTIPEMVPAIYTDVDPKLYPIAAWTVEAHLLKLEKEGLVERIGEKGWALAEPTA
jgi:glyoxylase-like metal-dependent hydrolase (beta-lactamase superfamily II)